MLVSIWNMVLLVAIYVIRVAQYALLAIGLYFLIISMFGWVRRKEPKAEGFEPVNKFAMIVAAHNEERVISGIVKNLKSLKYPIEKYEIFVIADNCDDRTAEIARENGARVFERADATRKGKGYALEWMFKKLFALEENYDAICILDADNLVSKNFLMEMNKQLCLGHKVVQGYLDSKNPHDTWISGNYSLSYWISNRLFQLPRHYLGLNCALGGTGFVMATSVLRDIGWGATCLTEDLEFSIKLVLKGMRVAWAHDAHVYDEKPLKLKQSWKQRTRWMQGHCDCAERFLKDLIVKAFKEKDKVAFDLGIYLIQPFIIVLNAIAIIAGAIKFFIYPVINTPFHMPMWLFAIAMIVLTYIYIVFVYIEGKLTPKVFAYFILFPVYSLTWVPIIVQGYFGRHNREWVDTVHTRAMDIGDIEGLEKVG